MNRESSGLSGEECQEFESADDHVSEARHQLGAVYRAGLDTEALTELDEVLGALETAAEVLPRLLRRAGGPHWEEE